MSPKHEDSVAVHWAKEVLSGAQPVPPFDTLRARVAELKGEDQFSWARRVLRQVDTEGGTESERRTWVRQQLALCTYKDVNLPTQQRVAWALKALSQEELIATTSAETLGIAGAIYKLRWSFEGRKQDLEQSGFFYERGHAHAKPDNGYPGINAAFVLDLLANEEDRDAREANTQSRVAEMRRHRAAEIRSELIRRLSEAGAPEGEDRWWRPATIAEAHFGLRDYDTARDVLARAIQDAAPERWQLQSTARQITDLARLHQEQDGDAAASEAARAVLRVLVVDETTAQLALLGKVGLALSGGGFRAALFHVGVLARLAELNILRTVDVLSCVSGGSIVGAQYYLELRHLLMTTVDGDLQDDILDIVSLIESRLLAAVQTNLRMRVAAHIPTNAKMLVNRNYSRTNRVGELLERELYSNIGPNPEQPLPGEPGSGARDAKRLLSSLYVDPKSEQPQARGFNLRLDNWLRTVKVPILVLNATSLNTGHNWQFTASWTGEPPAGTGSEIDANTRLRRMYNDGDTTPKNVQGISLGDAVAASACVPALFEPLPLSESYPDMVVRLADGGVHDNQGISSLLEQDCRILLVSDASGQTGVETNPDEGSLAVAKRSNDILMARVRAEQYRRLDMLRQSSVLGGMMFVHLKRDLADKPTDWIGCSEPDEDWTAPAGTATHTSYGIRRKVQRGLAELRTDLDSFSDAEAYALMYSGYRMAEKDLADCLPGFPTRERRRQWRFLAIEPAMTAPNEDDAAATELERVLAAGKNRFFRHWRLAGGDVARQLPSIPRPASMPAPLARVTSHLPSPRSIQHAPGRIAVNALLASVGWVAARAQIHVFDRWDRHQGSLDGILRRRPGGAGGPPTNPAGTDADVRVMPAD